MSELINERDREWHEYPIGTKAYSYNGGYWEKVSDGWKWQRGSTFPTPGAGWRQIELPTQ